MNEIDSLVERLNKYREDYYNGESSIDDEEFDFLERRLKSLDPNNDYFDQVGNKNSAGVIEIEHEIPMLSMQKVQTIEDAQKWCEDIESIVGSKIIIEIDPKLDGISGKIVYDSDGKFKYGCTRGDGLVGQIIPFADRVEGVSPKFIPNCELRGEFIIPKKYKSILNGALRNIGNGFMKRKEWSPEVDYMNFVIYDIHFYENPKEFTSRKDKIDFIKSNIPEWYSNRTHCVDIIETTDIKDIYEKYISSLRDKWDYETDGIIMTVKGNQDIYDLVDSKYKISTFHRYNMALKPPANYAQSKIIDIKSYTNRQKVSFVAVIDPITLMDVHVNRATLDTWKNIKVNNIGIGTTVLVKRTNDVIPKIFKTFNDPKDKIKFVDLTHCPSCGTELVPYYDGDLMCPNEMGCKDIFKSKIEHLINVVGIKNFGPVIISWLVDELYKDESIKELSFYELFLRIIPDSKDHYIYENKVIEYYNGGKRPEIFKSAINELFNSLTELTLIGGFNIPNIGVQTLINNKITTLKALTEYIKVLDKKPILESDFDKCLYNWYKQGKYVDLEKSVNLIKSKGFTMESDTIDNQNSITFCISGEVEGFNNKKEFINYICNMNSDLKFVDSVTVDTKYLVSSETKTSKVLKAKKYNIPILTSSEFIKKFGQC